MKHSKILSALTLALLFVLPIFATNTQDLYITLSFYMLSLVATFITLGYRVCHSDPSAQVRTLSSTFNPLFISSAFTFITLLFLGLDHPVGYIMAAIVALNLVGHVHFVTKLTNRPAFTIAELRLLATSH